MPETDTPVRNASWDHGVYERLAALNDLYHHAHMLTRVMEKFAPGLFTEHRESLAAAIEKYHAIGHRPPDPPVRKAPASTI